MIDEWFGDCLRNHPNIPRPPLPPARFEEEVPQECAEFWFENTTRVLEELSCTPTKCLNCTVSLLKDSVYRWWKTISSVTPRESITWEFFQVEFKKKFISQRFLGQKRKELLELKQGNRTVSEYEREFIRLSQYAKKWVQTEAEMCKCFEEGLNEEIKLLIWILEIRELVALVDRAKKVEELNNERMQAKKEARVSSRPPQHPESASGSRIVAKDSTVKPEARAPVRTYAIRVREEASAPDVIKAVTVQFRP
ncbi:uncharacterized protein LOC128291591 [Gossypium arboreum]|uniref:uncharacterized protein LOC128291591 n=1 Tax=Gossypium arboreum TaxID=29729 RepID=UPI0022F17558|nr:uncharacterized protein LOC128291591 [Gossypium arboreum]